MLEGWKCAPFRLHGAHKFCICCWKVTPCVPISRITDVSINTVTHCIVDAGAACLVFQDETIRSINSKRARCNEIWSFCYSKERSVALEDKGSLGYGDAYT